MIGVAAGATIGVFGDIDIDEKVLKEIESSGADPAGEHGEYHSLVVDGPIFEGPVDVVLGEVSLRVESGSWT